MANNWLVPSCDAPSPLNVRRSVARFVLPHPAVEGHVLYRPMPVAALTRTPRRLASAPPNRRFYSTGISIISLPSVHSVLHRISRSVPRPGFPSNVSKGRICTPPLRTIKSYANFTAAQSGR